MRKQYFALLLCSGFGFAQQLPVTTITSLENPDSDINFGSTGIYAQDTANERDQYVGTWEYNQNGTLFQIKIQKKDQILSNWLDNYGNTIRYNYCDVVFFTYKLIINGNTIYNNLNQDVFPEVYASQAIKKGIDNDLYGSFLDATKNVVGTVSIKRLDTTPPKITFNMSTGAYFLLNPDESYNQNEQLFYVPTGEIEMVKIN